MNKISFKVWCDKKKTRFYWVHIFKNKETMQAWNLKDGYNGSKRYAAVARSYSRQKLVKGRWKVKKDEQGCVSFDVHTLGAGIVSHEFTHAALYWFHAKYKDYRKLDNSKHDELLAWVQGNLVRQFWYQFYKLKKSKRIKRLK